MLFGNKFDIKLKLKFRRQRPVYPCVRHASGYIPHTLCRFHISVSAHIAVETFIKASEPDAAGTITGVCELMKSIFMYITVSAVILFSGCVSRQIIPAPPAEPIIQGNELFSEAETLYNQGAYVKSLDAYQEYIARYPDRPLAAAAMMKIGEIHAIQGQAVEARRAYSLLISRYPGSSFSNDARVNILASLYEGGLYQEVIRQAAEALEDMVSKEHTVRIYAILGDTYLAKGMPVDAANFYLSAYHKSQKPEKSLILVKLKATFARLEALDILSLLSRMKDDDFLEAYLMYHLGEKYAEEKKYDKAVRVLTDFLNRFPNHEYSGQAAGLIEELNLRAVYNGSAVGCLLPLSGPYETYGQRALKGVELALSRFLMDNSSLSVSLIIKDTASDPKKTVEAVQQLADQHVAAIIGPVITVKEAAEEAQRHGIPIVTLTQKSGITEIGDYVFRHFITPEMQVNELVNYCVSELGLKRFAMLYPEEQYGTAFMNLFWDKVVSAGGQITGVESYDSSQTDFADPIKKLVGLYYKEPRELRPSPEEPSEASIEEPALDPPEQSADMQIEDDETVEDGKSAEDEDLRPIVDFDAIFIPDSTKKAGLIIPQLAYYDVTGVYLLGTNLWHSGQLLEMTRQYAQKAIIPDGFFPQSHSPEVAGFVALFRETFGEPPGFMEAITYDTAMMVLDIIRNPEIRSRKQFRNQLADLKNFDGVTGMTSFDQTGEAFKQLYLLRIRGNSFMELNRR